MRETGTKHPRGGRVDAVLVATIVTALTLSVSDVWAQASSSAGDRTLVVGTKVTEPFVMRDATGTWRGISIELWENIARETGWTFEYRELELTPLIEATRDGSIDAAVAAFTVTPEREEILDFSHPFYSTGLGLTVPSRGSGWMGVLRRVASRRFLAAVGGLCVLLLVVGALVWLFERRRNEEEFGGKALDGIASGFWWSAVTMTTVGYGDKSPRTFGGRLVGLLWMFAGIIMISTFTAAITSSLTLTQLQTRVQGPEDLPNARVGTLEGSAPASALANRGISYRGFPNLPAALEALKAGTLDVVVYDAPILLYRVKEQFQGDLTVLPRTFESSAYAIMLPPESDLREPINRALLRFMRSQEWNSIVRDYLGE